MFDISNGTCYPGMIGAHHAHDLRALWESSLKKGGRGPGRQGGGGARALG